MKLLFNTSTKSIVLYDKGKYYDMRNGNEVTVEGKLPVMRPYDKYTLSKPEAVDAPLSLAALGIDITIIDGKCQFGGNYPRYFWKGLVRLIRTTRLTK